jgi:hypothetical protein
MEDLSLDIRHHQDNDANILSQNLSEALEVQGSFDLLLPKGVFFPETTKIRTCISSPLLTSRFLQRVTSRFAGNSIMFSVSLLTSLILFYPWASTYLSRFYNFVDNIAPTVVLWLLAVVCVFAALACRTDSWLSYVSCVVSLFLII